MSGMQREYKQVIVFQIQEAMFITEIYDTPYT